MDLPGQLWVIGLVVIFLSLFFITGIQYQIPMLVRANFDDACNNYLAVIEREGGLSSTYRSQLKAELNNLKIQNVRITAPTKGNWGDHVKLVIEGEYEFETTNPATLTKEKEMKNIKYENSTVILCNE